MTAERAAVNEIISLIHDGWKLKYRSIYFNTVVLYNKRGDILSVILKTGLFEVLMNGRVVKREVYKH